MSSPIRPESMEPLNDTGKVVEVLAGDVVSSAFVLPSLGRPVSRVHGGGLSVAKIAEEMVYVMETLANLVAKEHIQKDFCHETHVVAPRALVWFRATPFFHI